VVTNPQKDRGDRAERELAGILADQLGIPVRRKLGAGRTDDEGDLDGLPDTCVEVKSYRDIVRGLREGLDDSVREQANAGATHGVAFIRRPGGRWFAAMTIEQWCTLWREATG
jgi:hypothetical protein